MPTPQSRRSPKARKVAASRLLAAERVVRALELRRGGHTYFAIGEQLGVTEARAHQIITAELARLEVATAEAAEAVRRIEVERLDAMVRATYPEAVGRRTRWIKGEDGQPDRAEVVEFPPEMKAVEVLLKISERRCALLGVDAPATPEPPSVILAAFNTMLDTVYADPIPATPPDGPTGD